MNKISFLRENVDLLFKTESGKGTFIAEVNDCFSDYLTRNVFNLDWVMKNFTSGRYVIFVYQRYSVFKDGKQVWINKDYISEVGDVSRYKSPRFVVILDQEMEYEVPGWRAPLRSHTIRNPKNPLNATAFTDIKEAERTAQEYSRQGKAAAVMAWYADYDMY